MQILKTVAVLQAISWPLRFIPSSIY